jgi:outer membrane protein TolC
MAQQSPEFAYSAEKWATLRDNTLEYDEIADLVHEYNNTVLQNAISYRDEKDKTAEDVAQDYYDAADNIYSNSSMPDSDSDNYGSGVSSYLNNQISAENLVEQGDKSTDNAETIKLGYDQTEATLVKQAQQQMISYYSQLYSLESLRQTKTQAEADLAAEQKRLAAGTSTQAKVLSAQQKVSSAEASIQSAESSLAKTKESLLVMLGWSYGSDVTIGDLPEPNLDAINAIDFSADLATAKENNYSLKKTTLQLSNARSTSVKDTLTQTKYNAEQAIGNSLSSTYQSLMLAVSSYEQAQQSFAIQQTAMDTANRKKQAGTITDNAYLTIQTSYQNAQVTVQTRKLALLTAYVDYQWAVNGLASAS